MRDVLYSMITSKSSNFLLVKILKLIDSNTTITTYLIGLYKDFPPKLSPKGSVKFRIIAQKVITIYNRLINRILTVILTSLT